MHWTVGQLIGFPQHPFVSDCIPLYHRMTLNYFKPLKLYLIINHHKLGVAPLLSVGFTETCPVYLLLTVTLWSVNLHYKFLEQAFLYYVGLTVFSIFFFLFLFRPHVMVCEMFVIIGMQLQLHIHHYRFKVPASWTPRIVTWLCWMLVSCC